MLRAWRQWVPSKRRPASIQRHLLRLERLEGRTLPSFIAAPTYDAGYYSTTGSDPVAIATGDFNRDGKLDVVTANKGSNDISLFLGNGNGTFQPAENIFVGKSPDAILAVDLTGDGKLDIVVANEDNNTVSVLMGNGNGTFQPAKTYAAGTSPVALAYGDFTGDHHVDLAIADNGSDTVTLLLNDGKGNFTPGGTVTVINNPTSVAVGDFNHDGFDDIATVSGGFAHLDVNLNNGNGTFAAPVNYDTGFVANTVVVGDFTGTGKLDLAVACKFPSTDGVSILLGNGDGTFQPFKSYSVGGQTPITLTVADLTGNGVQDIVTANGQFANNSVSVLMGNGDGTFGPASVYTAGENPQAVAVGDFNGDGVPDVVTANTGQNLTPVGSISMLLGNGDGTLLTSPDLIVPGPGPSVEADFTGDGIPDLAVISSSVGYSGVYIFPGLGNGEFGAPILTPSISSPSSIAVGDFTGNHVMDLAVTSANGVSILLGNGNGTFQTPVVYPAGPSPSWVAVDDFTGNGILDLAVADNAKSGGGVSILLGKGDGTFGTATTYAAGGAANYLTTGDINGDHKDDIAVVNGGSNTVSILLGNGDGTFGSPTTFTTRVGPGSVGLGNFSGNGKLELAVPTFFGSGSGSEFSIYQESSTGAYTMAAAYTTGGSLPMGIAVADFGGSKLGIAVANNFSDDVFVFPGLGNNLFGSSTGYVVGDGPTWLTAGDFNGNGSTDLAVSNSNSGTVTLLETPLPATHFRVSMVPVATAGNAFQVIVTALDADNRIVTGYTGSVSFTSTDLTATLPGTYKFTAADHGVHRFTIILRRAGSTDFTVHSGSATGSGSVTVAAAAANHLSVTASPATAGTPFDVTVTALDPFGNVATSFQGTIHLSTSEPPQDEALPSDYTFTAGDNGQVQFTTMTLNRAGIQTLTATDTLKPTVKGSAKVVVNPAAFSKFSVSGIPLTVVVNKPYLVTVVAQDNYGNVITGYLGTVQFSITGGTAMLPGPYTFTAKDKGKHVFKVTFQSTGANQAVIVEDQSDTGDSGTESGINVR
jgi:hypothetical protein